MLRLIATVFFLLWAAFAHAAPIVNVFGSLAVDGEYTLTISLTAPATANRYLIVGCGQETGGGSNFVGVTWNTTESFTSLANFHDGGNQRLTLWRLINPTSGSHDIVIEQDNPQPLTCGAILFTGVNQTVAEGSVETAFDLSATVGPSINVDSGAGEYVVDVVFWGALPGTAGGGQSEQINQIDAGANRYLTMSTEPGAAGVITMSWSDSSTSWSQAGVSLKPAAAAVTVRRRAVIVQ